MHKLLKMFYIFVKYAASRSNVSSVLYLDKIVGDEVLILEPDLGILDELHHGLIIDQDVTLTRRTGNRLTRALVHDLCRQVFGPA